MQKDYTLQSINSIAQEVWNSYSHKKIWIFDAPMGAGKTTFIKELCQNILQSKDIISSPTFSIINEYESPLAGKIFHMDWYRLKDEEEAINAGVEEVLYSGNLCLVEWPERAAALLPENILHLKIEILDQELRRISIK
ncbi:MAG: tRNA (adenosine(37)-N6)-threonylcarbamoyltransferase complex ATPase subunit type 1 TsaE [Arachidicoccus sp.]|nr:tRNA (adenosine(37)-N6)-threonylcarbamoyltransferase complex ATPase subunit type 1 TsaE [Arachidicoccus sp.]